MKKMIMILCLLSAGNRFASAQDTARADASLSTATVYFGYGAELTHNSTLKLSKRTTQIIISQLSNSIDINTLQISVPENVAPVSYTHLDVYKRQILTCAAAMVKNL